MIRRNWLGKIGFQAFDLIPGAAHASRRGSWMKPRCRRRPCELVSQLNESNVKQSLSGTAAVLTPCPSASIPAALMFPLNPPTGRFTLRLSNTACCSEPPTQTQTFKRSGRFTGSRQQGESEDFFPLSEAIKQEDVCGDIKKTDSYATEVTFDSLRLWEETSRVPMWACFIVRWDLLCDANHAIKMKTVCSCLWAGYFEGQNNIDRLLGFVNEEIKTYNAFYAPVLRPQYGTLRIFPVIFQWYCY